LEHSVYNDNRQSHDGASRVFGSVIRMQKRRNSKLTLRRPLLSYGYSCYKASCARPG